jgi:NAD+ diphosphatase
VYGSLSTAQDDLILEMQKPSRPYIELSRQIPFGENDGLNRLSEKRDDPVFVAALRIDPSARTLIFVGDIPLLRQTDSGINPWFRLNEAEAVGTFRELALLGKTGEGPRFAALLDETIAVTEGEPDPNAMIDKRNRAIPARPDLLLTDLRSIALAGTLRPSWIAMQAQAKSLLFWHASHRFCSNCGLPSIVASAGWRRDCPSCKRMHFPRTDPVVIMLAVDGDRCLMGRSHRFGKGMYSALAGFLEPGETIEEAVRREISEESGILTSEVTYLASQPWPFPASLMIGCLATAVTTEIKIDPSELEDCRWFTREEVLQMLSGTHSEGFLAPQKVAIAHHLLKAWSQL